METLPTELLRRVAGYTCYPTHLALSRVSRHIRAAVVDWAVYKSIVDTYTIGDLEETADGKPVGFDDTSYNFGYVPDPEEYIDEESQTKLWKWDPISASIPTALCARYAWADYQARNLPPFRQLADENYVREFSQWAGILAALRHPFIAALGSRYLRGKSEEARYFWSNEERLDSTTLYTTAFCRSAALLSVPPTPTDAHFLRSTWDFVLTVDDPLLGQLWCRIETALDEARVFDDMDRPFEGTSVPRTASAINESQAASQLEAHWTAFPLHQFCVRAIGILGYRLRVMLSCYDGEHPFTNHILGGESWSQRGFDPRMIRPPPTANQIPFADFMELPPPGLETTTTAFVWCHLRKMTTQAFIEDGRWMGVYTYRSGRSIDPLMVDIKLRVVDITAPNSNSDDDGNADGEVLDIAAAGFDAVGDFTLYGKIYRATGKVVIKKVYSIEKQNERDSDWLAFMTPFGIVGHWRDRFHSGYVWLWKEDWYGDT
ncbi:hypothetical protein ABW21_db0206584 [Orbilia brochopaga]|nr:hypothetical protein ABW21_db0206584 [Drechslerella brochopaga]